VCKKMDVFNNIYGAAKRIKEKILDRMERNPVS
jgi:hypothetical protein